MTPKAQLRLLTVASYATLALTALVLALCLMSVAQATGTAPWDAGAWWTFALPSAKDAGFIFTVAAFAQMIIQYLRNRAAWRVAALAGDVEAMPLALPALVLGESESAETILVPAPTTLRWGLTSLGRLLRLLPWCALGCLAIGSAALLLWLQATFIDPSLAPGDPLYLVDYAGEGVFALVGVVMIAFALRTGPRGPTGVSADSAGISAWTPRGLGPLLPWREARLLEVSWFGLARKKPVPYVRVYRADGSSIGWPLMVAPVFNEEFRHEPIGMSYDEAAEAARAITRLAVSGAGLPMRTTHRSLTDASIKLEQELSRQVRMAPTQFFGALTVGALAVAALAYHWGAAPWLSMVAAVGLGLCAARLAYWDAYYALLVPQRWDEMSAGVMLRYPLLWPSLLSLSSTTALAVSIAAVITGHAPRDTWTNVEVIGGAALLALGGALMTWARAQPDTVQPADLSPDGTGAPVAEPL